MSETIPNLLDPNCVLLKCNYTQAEEVISAVGMRLFEEGYVRDTSQHSENVTLSLGTKKAEGIVFTREYSKFIIPIT